MRARQTVSCYARAGGDLTQGFWRVRTETSSRGRWRRASGSRTRRRGCTRRPRSTTSRWPSSASTTAPVSVFRRREAGDQE
eukprot:1729601-Rhodomonas_salina.2